MQDIRLSDHVITHSAGLVRINAVSRHRVLQQAVSIASGLLDDTRPDSDMVLHADQHVLIRDWRAQALFGRDQALVPASDLIDGQFICGLGGKCWTCTSCN